MRNTETGHIGVICVGGVKMTDKDDYEQWLDEWVSVRDETGYPLTNREYYKRYFESDIDPKEVYTELREAFEENRSRWSKE